MVTPLGYSQILPHFDQLNNERVSMLLRGHYSSDLRVLVPLHFDEEAFARGARVFDVAIIRANVPKPTVVYAPTLKGE
ncbi:MAG TPA: hypothetical protein VLZ78_04015 [Terrimesophilobacter sp.]|nr:hypothetical protein [Terrimesophilobacter sp.]